MAISVLAQRDALGVKGGQIYVGGVWRDGAGEPWTHVHPASGESVVELTTASAADVDAAVQAARKAFDEGPWPRLTAKERIAALRRLEALIRRDAEEIDRLQTLDNGLPQSFVGGMYAVGAEICADMFDHHAGWIDKLTGEVYPTYTGPEKHTFSLTEPVGVVAAIIPWNAPVMLYGQKVAPALAAGCTVVLKPSEFASLAVLKLAQLVEEAELPPGVFNLVLGTGPVTGEALITHPGVDKITFTGSRAVGQHILSSSGTNGLRRVSLELGGKSPNLIFADCESLDMAAMAAFGAVTFGLSGQGCVCQTRALVERSIYDEFLDKAQLMAGMVKFGDPFDPATTSGPIINTKQIGRIMGLIEKGVDEGARLVVGGDRPSGELSAGNWVNPTLFADVANTMTIAREEVFGPVLVAIPFDSEEEAIRLANDSDYGLGAGIQTANTRRALRVAARLRAGTVGVNTFAVHPNAPFGGYKTSGLGREGGYPGIHEFLETKTVVVAVGEGY